MINEFTDLSLAMMKAAAALREFGELLAQGHDDFARELHVKADAQGARQWVRIL